MRDNFVPAKKMAMALQTLISSRFPRDYLGIVVFSEVAREITPAELPTVMWDYIYGTNLQHALALSQLLVVVVSFALATALALERVEIWHLFAFTLLAGVGMVFDRTLRNTLVFGTVARKDVANALALNSIAFSMMRTLGPAAAGFLIAWVGSAWNFALQGLLYLGVAAMALTLNTPHEEPRRASPAPAFTQMKEGLVFAATDPVARNLMLLGAVPAFLLIPSFSALMPVFAVHAPTLAGGDHLPCDLETPRREGAGRGCSTRADDDDRERGE